MPQGTGVDYVVIGADNNTRDIDIFVKDNSVYMKTFLHKGILLTTSSFVKIFSKLVFV